MYIRPFEPFSWNWGIEEEEREIAPKKWIIIENAKKNALKEEEEGEEEEKKYIYIYI